MATGTDDLWAWRVFLAVARTGSLSGAADRLERDVSTVSRAMSGLEKALGCELFRHNTRPLQLSEAGRKALRRIENTLRAHDQMIEDLRSESRALTGRIRLSTAQGFATRRLMPILERFTRHHPELSIDIRTGVSEADVAKGLCDIAVLTGEPTLPGLVYTSRGRNVYLPVASPDYIHSFGLPLTPQQLRGHRGYIYTGPVRPETKSLVRGAQEESLEFAAVTRSTDVLAIRQAVLSGMGIAVDMPLVQIFEDLLENRLVPILPGWYRPPIECWVVTHRDAWHLRRVRLFFEWFAQEMRKSFEGYETQVASIMGLPPDTEQRKRGEIYFTSRRSAKSD